MSAYGSFLGPKAVGELESYRYPIANGILTTHPVTASEAPRDLVEYLYQVFSQELEDGKTYPQEGPMDLEGFETYFFKSASATIIGILHDIEPHGTGSSLEDARAGRSWEDCVGGCFYVKPNYPGRSSHICNGGFLVPNKYRGRRIGVGLAKSYVLYAPRLGYRASVFNLVYKNNAASVRLWEQLDFRRVGCIPQAGRLKSGPNGEEEYVDALVMYKAFPDPSRDPPGSPNMSAYQR